MPLVSSLMMPDKILIVLLFGHTTQEFCFNQSEALPQGSFEACCLLTIPTYGVGAYSRWMLIWGLKALNLINVVLIVRLSANRWQISFVANNKTAATRKHSWRQSICKYFDESKIFDFWLEFRESINKIWIGLNRIKPFNLLNAWFIQIIYLKKVLNFTSHLEKSLNSV